MASKALECPRPCCRMQRGPPAHAVITAGDVSAEEVVCNPAATCQCCLAGLCSSRLLLGIRCNRELRKSRGQVPCRAGIWPNQVFYIAVASFQNEQC